MPQNSPNIRGERIKGHIDLDGSTTYSASLRLRPGVTPSSPQDGELWYNGSSLVTNMNGSYQQLAGATGSSGLPGPTGPTGPTNNTNYFNIDGGSPSTNLPASNFRIDFGSV